MFESSLGITIWIAQSQKWLVTNQIIKWLGKGSGFLNLHHLIPVKGTQTNTKFTGLAYIDRVPHFSQLYANIDLFYPSKTACRHFSNKAP